jgi:hypothetical protein
MSCLRYGKACNLFDYAQRGFLSPGLLHQLMCCGMLNSRCLSFPMSALSLSLSRTH